MDRIVIKAQIGHIYRLSLNSPGYEINKTSSRTRLHHLEEIAQSALDFFHSHYEMRMAK